MFSDGDGVAAQGKYKRPSARCNYRRIKNTIAMNATTTAIVAI
jgi:hypothetical protein